MWCGIIQPVSDLRPVVTLAVLLVTGCGAAAGAPAVTSTPRPADAATAVAQAIARTAGFIDVKYDQLNTTTAGTSVSAFSGTIVATKNPARTEVKSAPTSGSGAALDSVEDYSAGTFCTVQPGPRQRLTGQSTDAASVSPFSELQNSVTGWSYASDPGGAPQWHRRDHKEGQPHVWHGDGVQQLRLRHRRHGAGVLRALRMYLLRRRA